MKRPTFAIGLALGLCLWGTGSAQAQDLYGISTSTDELIRINPVTGAGVAVGSLGISVSQAGADFACDGTLWVFSRDESNSNTGILYTVNLNTGAATVVQTYDLTGFPGGAGLEFCPDERTLFWRAGTQLNVLNLDGTITNVTTTLSGASPALTINPSTCTDFFSRAGTSLIRINPLTGAETFVATLTLGFTALAAAPDGTLYSHRIQSLYTVALDGTVTLVGNIGFGIPGLAFGPRGVCCVEDDDFSDDDDDAGRDEEDDEDAGQNGDGDAG